MLRLGAIALNADLGRHLLVGMAGPDPGFHYVTVVALMKRHLIKSTNYGQTLWVEGLHQTAAESALPTFTL